MAVFHDNLPLRVPSPKDWLQAVEADFDVFLVDHAGCERKAAAAAMSLVGRFADRKVLIEPMICLAREELAHFHEVYRLLAQRGLQLAPGEQDPYVKALLRHARHGNEEHFLDRLLVSGVIEARSCERFLLLGQALTDPNLSNFYLRLGREEAGHYMIFLRIARNYFSEKTINERLDQLLDVEASIMLSTPLRPAVH